MRIKEDPGSPGTPKHLKGSCQDPGRSRSLSREVTPRPTGSFDPSGRDPAGQKCAWNRVQSFWKKRFVYDSRMCNNKLYKRLIPYNF